MNIKNLSFKFDQSSSDFFKNLTITFEPNTVHVIQGDNGVGKSTLFSILQGVTQKNAILDATIELDRVIYTADNNALPHAFTHQVHTVLQKYDSMLANQFSFVQNLQLANMARYPGLQGLPEATLLNFVTALQIHPDIPVHLLSGGQRQLLAICMALQKSTKLLLLDEPTATLDKKNAHHVMRCLYQLAQELKVTMVVICHDKELVAEYAQGNSFIMEQSEDGLRVLRVV
ncbi:MAG TPA: energy-coupling factor ABC transporter ATP-binding protein [Candidatus Babeliales bacterium]|nr:energy-coupling factor ABC transporter ATP-binding protein [Candidatus Babeliales bacterium]